MQGKLFSLLITFHYSADQLLGRRPNGFLGLSLNDRTILFLVTLLDKTVSVGKDSLAFTTFCLL